VTKILHGLQKSFCGGLGGLRVWWTSVMPLGPGPGQPTCSVMLRPDHCAQWFNGLWAAGCPKCKAVKFTRRSLGK
jgi:hypothetical protein